MAGAKRQQVSKESNPYAAKDRGVTPVEPGTSTFCSVNPSYNMTPSKQTNAVNSVARQNRQIKTKKMPQDPNKIFKALGFDK